MQVGSYCIMDTEYLAIESRSSGGGTWHGGAVEMPAMTLLSTVVSATHAPDFVTVDAGLKAMYLDGPGARVPPLVFFCFMTC